MDAQGSNLHPNKLTMVIQELPRFMAAAKINTPKPVLHASTLWSKSSPRGPLCLVLRLRQLSNGSPI